MRIVWKSPTGRDEVAARIAKAGKRRQTLRRDRLRVVLPAGDGDEAGGELFREQIAERAGRSRQVVGQWVGRYRAGGLDAMAAERQPGRAPKLTAARDEQLEAIPDGGPRPDDKLCTPRGRDVRRIVEVEFGVVYTAGGIYDVLRRPDSSSPKPRPRHRKHDPAKAVEFVGRAPVLHGT